MIALLWQGATDDTIYITGDFSGTNDFDPGGSTDDHTSLYGDFYAFITSYDSSGQYRWTRTWGAIAPLVRTIGKDIFVDSSGNVYATGYFDGDVDFDPGTATDIHSGPGDYLIKFNSDGSYQWVKTWPNGTSPDIKCPLTIDSNDNIIMSRTDETCDVMSMYKMDDGGTVLWEVDWPGIDILNKDLAVDLNNDIYMSGYFDGTRDFDPGSGYDSHTSNGLQDAYLLKVSSSGRYQWCRTWGGVGYDAWPCGAFISAKNNIYVCGSFQYTVDFDPDPDNVVDKTAVNPNGDMFMSCFDPSGKFLDVSTWTQEDAPNG